MTAQITVSLATLLGLDQTPGELTGHGPIPAAVARDLAASATVWRRLLTDPADAHLVTQTIKSYRPSPAMRAFVHARSNDTCAARGCTARTGLQIDHTTPWPHGPTSVTNFGLLHQPHHQGKTSGAWHHHLDPHTGALTQTSPLGHTYTTHPLPPLGDTPTGEQPALEQPDRGDAATHQPDARAPWWRLCPHSCPEHPPRLVRHRTTWRRLHRAVLTAGTDPPPDLLTRHIAAAFARDHHDRP